jgi:NAD(P)-dependent dehydrogenase (short-subunit alcohol dehydrogenase family)
MTHHPENGTHIVVLITGAASGIGLATTKLYSRKGAAVVMVGRDADCLEKTAAEVRQQDDLLLPLQCDVTVPAEAHDTIETIIKQFGHIDVLINNAGVAGKAAMVHETTDAIWREMLENNLSGAFRITREVLPHFMKREKGIIVNVSSVAATLGMPGMAAYSAAKSGLVALTRSIAVEYAHLGIRCNCVCPGSILTPMTNSFLEADDHYQAVISRIPLLRVGRPEEIAQTIYYLGSEQSSFTNGTVLCCDGGYSAL